MVGFGWREAGAELGLEALIVKEALGSSQSGMPCGVERLSLLMLHPPAAQALRPGGRLVYSTCSILDLENDGVVGRVLERAAGSLRVVAPAAAALEGAGAERTRHGWLLLPDAALASGPIYLAVVQKTASSSLKRVKQNTYAHLSRAAL